MSKSDLFERFNELNILIIGDVMIDRYLTGAVSRISPEAPVPVVHLQSEEDRLGGAANVALNIKALGATPFLCSCIGTDSNGQKFLNLLPENELSAQGIVAFKSRKTTVKTRIIASNQHLLRVDQEEIRDLDKEEETRFLNRLLSIMDQNTIHAILFQDYNKGVLSATLIQRIIQEARRRNIPSAVDPKNHNFWSYQKVDLFKPNLKEIRDQLPQFSIKPNLKSLELATAEIQKRLENQHTLITLSEKGLFLQSKVHAKILPTQKRQIADVCGAGDTVISVATLGLALAADMEQIAFLANLAGGQVCEKVGVVPVDKAQLKEEYLQFQMELD